MASNKSTGWLVTNAGWCMAPFPFGNNLSRMKCIITLEKWILPLLPSLSLAEEKDLVCFRITRLISPSWMLPSARKGGWNSRLFINVLIRETGCILFSFNYFVGVFYHVMEISRSPWNFIFRRRFISFIISFYFSQQLRLIIEWNDKRDKRGKVL